MTTTQDTAREATVTEARDDFARLVRDAEYGAATYAITRHGKTVARLVGPDAGRMPDPDLWQSAQEAYDKAIATGLVGAPRVIANVLAEFGHLLAAHYGYDQEAARACAHCDATVTRSGMRWVDGEGWDHCDGTSTSHEPAQEVAENA